MPFKCNLQRYSTMLSSRHPQVTSKRAREVRDTRERGWRRGRHVLALEGGKQSPKTDDAISPRRYPSRPRRPPPFNHKRLTSMGDWKERNRPSRARSSGSIANKSWPLNTAVPPVTRVLQAQAQSFTLSLNNNLRLN
jgi:hypothetical protein